jgi:hypothetical protein
MALEGSFHKWITGKKIKFKGKRDQEKFKKLILEKTTPPPEPGLGSFELFAAVFGGVFGMGVGIVISEILEAFFGKHFQALILIFAIAGYLKTLQLTYRRRMLKKKEIWDAKIKVWKASQLCLKCGSSWQT